MEFLNYHHLRYFREVAREGGLKKAAEKLHVSQSTISAQIQALENTLGERLFRRSGRGLVLTEEGHQVLSYAEEIFSLGQDLLDQIKQRPASRPVRVQIGVADSLPKLVAYHIIKTVFRLPYTVQAVCREGKLADLLSQLAAFRLDVVLADEPAPSSLHIKAFNHLLGECGVSFCATPALGARLSSGFPQSLNGAPALLPTPNNGLRRSLEQWFHSHRIRPRLVAEFEDMALSNIAAGDGLGYIAIPNLVVQQTMARYGLECIGSTEQCREQVYAISSERKLVHPAVIAITSQAQTTLFANNPATEHDGKPCKQTPGLAPQA